jgi:HK97 family phage portal protein
MNFARGSQYGSINESWEQREKDSADFFVKAIGDRMMAELFAPSATVLGSGAGTWTSDRYQQVLRYTGWQYIGTKAICEEIAGLMPQFGFLYNDEQAGPRKAMGKKFLRPQVRQKALVGAQDADEIEMVPPTHPLLKILNRPNEIDTSWSLRFKWFLYAELTGNSYLWKIRNQLGQPFQLYVIPAHWMWARGSQDHMVAWYEVRPFGGYGGARSIQIPANDIIHLSFPGPLSVIDGWSPAQAGAPWFDVGQSMDISRLAAFKRGVVSSMILSLDPQFGNVKDADLDRIQARIDSRYAGESNFARAMLLQGGIVPHQTTRTPQEMDFGVSGDQNRDWQLAVRRVSKFIAGISEDVNFASSVSALANFIRGTIKPKLMLAGQILTEQLAKEFDQRAICFWPDPTPNDPAQVNADILADFQTGAITPNEIRRLRGREPYEFGGDDPFMPGNVAPVAWKTGATAAAPPVQMDIEDEEEVEQSAGPDEERDDFLEVEPGYQRPYTTPHPVTDPRVNGRPTVHSLQPSTNGHSVLVKTKQLQMLEVPDIRQEDQYSCGACAAMSVGRYFGVGPKSLESWKAALGTTLQLSTHPQAIAKFLGELGLHVEMKERMSVDDLQQYTRLGWPVICCVQDYGNRREPGAAFAYGHYLTVVGVGFGRVFCQDASIDNVIEDEADNITEPGKIMVPFDVWNKVWYDQDVEGTPFEHLGICVGPKGE